MLYEFYQAVYLQPVLVTVVLICAAVAVTGYAVLRRLARRLTPSARRDMYRFLWLYMALNIAATLVSLCLLYTSPSPRDS